jgi:3-mercaptopyruvate sulfurtransferase SseA
VQDPKKPWLLVDKLTAQKRLGLLGIRPRTPVVVIGYGPKGKGEEGRLAWLLLYYGIDDVQTVSVNGLDVYFTHQDSQPRINSEAWDTPVREQFLIDRNQFLNAAMSNRKTGNHAIHIIDVRSKDEYNNKNVQYETPDLRALQIDVHEFFSEDGRPAKSVRSKLRGIGVKMDDEVILISSDSVRSSAAAYSLLALGFKNVRNFLGGWESLVKKR